ncbi:zinc ribbon domain-containing protein [Caldilinea sp.]|uniref:zinc ribbon domain-containing protein n=1 Tax=Caldilinea sp. TaxID=2293560 RepID=UPI002BD08F18|nr:zinc ribbon domain-containing protein [Anaerolineales bacterium]HQY91831.1 zinc ribbon domain-containing protein [Caldilinea sp.]HRA65201.1 zinc ribbon domain-containing protein [Caldilinea sp.]
MTEISRICPQCGKSFPMEARHCSHCGHDREAALPALQSNLPALVGKATAPLLAGAASLALGLGWKLLQGMLSRPAKPEQQPIQVRNAAPLQPRGRMTIRITTAWAVGDSSGNWREGHSEQTIEIE